MTATRIHAAADRAADRTAARAERDADARSRTAERRLGLSSRPAAQASAEPGLPTERLAERPGRPLERHQREPMERAFGHGFGHVRVHSDAAARGAAHRLGAHAFTVGSHIALANPSPRVLAHELGHVVAKDRGEDRPEAVRRVSVGEWFARLVGEGSYSADELDIYLAKIAKGEPEGTGESDDKARQVVRDGKHVGQSLETRKAMILDMMSGFTGNDDEQAILKLLEDAPMAEREWLIEKIGGMSALEDEFHGEEFEKLTRLLGGVARQRNAEVPLDWAVKYTVEGAEEFRGRTGVLLNSIGFDPTGPEAGFTPVAANESLLLGGGQEQRLGTGPVPHPRGKGGEGFADVQVGPVVEETGVPVVVAPSGQASRTIRTQPPYQAVDPLKKRMIAEFKFQLTTKEVGENMLSSTSSRSTMSANEAWMENSLGSEQSSEVAVGSEQERSLRRKAEVKKWQRVGKAATQERQKGQATTAGSATTKGTVDTTGHVDTKETVVGDETSGATNTIDGGAEFSGKFDADLEGEIKKASSTWVTVGRMLLKLGSLAPGVYGRVLRRLGPIGDKILSFFEPDEDDLEIEFDAKGNFELKGTFKAKSSIEAWRKYSETRTGTQDSKSKSVVDQKTDSKSTTDSVVDVTRATVETEQGAEAGQGVEAGVAERKSVVSKQGQKKTQANTTGKKEITGKSATEGETKGRTDKIIVPVMRDGGVTLTFRAE